MGFLSGPFVGGSIVKVRQQLNQNSSAIFGFYGLTSNLPKTILKSILSISFVHLVV